MATESPFSKIPSQLEQIPEDTPIVFISYSWVTGYFLWVEVALSQYSEYSEHEERDIVDASQVCPKDFNL